MGLKILVMKNLNNYGNLFIIYSYVKLIRCYHYLISSKSFEKLKFFFKNALAYKNGKMLI